MNTFAVTITKSLKQIIVNNIQRKKKIKGRSKVDQQQSPDQDLRLKHIKIEIMIIQ